jgi:hypothetical protein
VYDSSEDSLGPVFERSWFYRVWTVQEVTLPLVENIIVRYGSIAFPWIFLLMAVNYLKITKYRWGKWNEATHLQKYISGFQMDKRQNGFRGIFDYEPNNVDLYQGILQILASARAKKATKPKDKIFALFGVMKELEVGLPLPNYQKSLQQVYTEAAIACINHDRCLHILFEAPSDNRRSKLPSWCLIGVMPDGDPQIRGKLSSEKGFQAAGSTSPLRRFSPDQRRLLLSGRLIDSIHHRGAPLEFDSEFDLSFLSIASGKLEFPEFLRKIHPTFGVLRSWVDISSQYKEYPTGETVQIALRHTLVDGEVRQASDSSTESAHNIMTSSDMNGLSRWLQNSRPLRPALWKSPKSAMRTEERSWGSFQQNGSPSFH